jgi:hypothetical protein
MRIGNHDDNPDIHKNTLRIGIFLAPFLLFLPLFTGKVLFWGTAGLQFIPWAFCRYQCSTRVYCAVECSQWNGATLIANYQNALFTRQRIFYMVFINSQALRDWLLVLPCWSLCILGGGLLASQNYWNNWDLTSGQKYWAG